MKHAPVSGDGQLAQFLADHGRTINEAQLSALTGGTLEHVHLVIPMDQMTRNQMYPELAVRVMVALCTRCRRRCWFDTQSTVAPGLGTVVCYECATGHFLRGPDGVDAIFGYRPKTRTLDEAYTQHRWHVEEMLRLGGHLALPAPAEPEPAP